MPTLRRQPKLDKSTYLDEAHEKNFRQWYGAMAQMLGLDQDPDNPLHFYDYRAAYKAGVRGPNLQGHWPSEFKREQHPNRFINGYDTMMGRGIFDEGP